MRRPMPRYLLHRPNKPSTLKAQIEHPLVEIWFQYAVYGRAVIYWTIVVLVNELYKVHGFR